MSKKTLLNETTVRRFMKLADMGTLSDNFINEAGYGMHQQDETDLEEGGMGMDAAAAYQDDEPEMDDMDAEAPEMPGDEGPEDEPMPEEPMPEEEPEMDADEVEITEEDRAALEAALSVISKITGAGGEEMDMGGEEMDMGGEEMDMAPEEPEMGEEDEEALMQEVARRVAHRLRKEGLETKGGNSHNEFKKQKDHRNKKAKDAGLASGGPGLVKEDELEEGEEILDEVEVVDENELVQEVTRRVAARLRAAMKSRK